MGGLLVTVLGASFVVSACSSSKGASTTSTFQSNGSSGAGAGHAASTGNGTGTASASGGDTGVGGGFSSTASGLGGSFAGSTGAGGANTQGFVVTPTGVQTVTLAPGQTTLSPPLVYTATFDGQPTNVAWSVDRGDAASVSSALGTSTTFSPSGTLGGLVNLTASQNGTSITRQIFLKLAAPLQNGANGSSAEAGQIVPAGSAGVAKLTQGGGVGGVGGEGLGPAPTSFPTATQPASAIGLTLLYPYDKTVWPRGLPAPLLQWSASYPADAGAAGADAIEIDVATTSGSFSWSGRFGPPAVLSAAGLNFTRSPIPQDVWAMATNTAGGATLNGQPDQLTVSLTVAKGGVAYGPITETWTIAPGQLAGTVYYNSYGTSLIQNSNGTDYNGVQYGAAVLAIPPGGTAPVITAGTAGSTQGEGCRVCHVLSADGSKLIAQHGNSYATTSVYDLKKNNAETVLTGNDSTFGWAGLSPDGTQALTNGAQLAAGTQVANAVYAFPPTAAPATALASNGLPADLIAGSPTYSSDGKHVSFELIGGTLGNLVGSITPSQLVSLDFDSTTMTFSNPKLLATAPGGGDASSGNGGQNAGFPAFFPTNDAIVFHKQLTNPAASHRYNTWLGATAQVWWSDLASGTATSLATLNGYDLASGTSYLPTGPTNPGNDTVLNYEPTVAPIATGGYAWVIFTSRRLYGSIATADPTQSDPRSYDNTAYANITCKKLWVAAVDIGSIQNGTFMEGVKAGTDPSHPAFYLPGQEIVAGNARAFWVLDPCRANGASCQTGDQCCNGFCEAVGDGGALTCGSAPTTGCAGLQDKCTTASDCCDTSNLCIGGFCAMPPPT